MVLICKTPSPTAHFGHWKRPGQRISLDFQCSGKLAGPTGGWCFCRYLISTFLLTPPHWLGHISTILLILSRPFLLEKPPSQSSKQSHHWIFLIHAPKGFIPFITPLVNNLLYFSQVPDLWELIQAEPNNHCGAIPEAIPNPAAFRSIPIPAPRLWGAIQGQTRQKKIIKYTAQIIRNPYKLCKCLKNQTGQENPERMWLLSPAGASGFLWNPPRTHRVGMSFSILINQKICNTQIIPKQL